MLSVREITSNDIKLITNYWLKSDPTFLKNMGVDISKMPSPDEWFQMLSEQLNSNYSNKKSYCIIWELNGEAIGHSNVNKIIYKEEAYMHLHIWYSKYRNLNYGETLITLTLPFFYNNLKLKRVICEPYALNPGPNKLLEKIGFKLERQYITIPGWLNFEQEVKQWVLTNEHFRKINL